MLKQYFEKELKRTIKQWELAEKREDTNSMQFFAWQIYALENTAKAFGFKSAN